MQTLSICLQSIARGDICVFVAMACDNFNGIIMGKVGNGLFLSHRGIWIFFIEMFLELI